MTTQPKLPEWAEQFIRDHTQTVEHDVLHAECEGGACDECAGRGLVTLEFSGMAPDDVRTLVTRMMSEGEVTITTNERGECVAVTRTDEARYWLRQGWDMAVSEDVRRLPKREPAPELAVADAVKFEELLKRHHNAVELLATSELGATSQGARADVEKAAEALRAYFKASRSPVQEGMVMVSRDALEKLAEKPREYDDDGYQAFRCRQCGYRWYLGHPTEQTKEQHGEKCAYLIARAALSTPGTGGSNG